MIHKTNKKLFANQIRPCKARQKAPRYGRGERHGGITIVGNLYNSHMMLSNEVTQYLKLKDEVCIFYYQGELVLAKSVPLKEISRYRLSGNGKKMVYCNELVKELEDHFGCNFALDTHFYFECVESAILSGNPVIIVKNQ